MKRDTRHAPYGTACKNCSRMKCRCVIPKAGDRCERCRRLDKECIPSGMARTRNSKKTSATRNQLEAKIDGLVTLLTSSNIKPPGTADPCVEVQAKQDLGRQHISQSPRDSTAVPNLNKQDEFDAITECDIHQEDDIFKEFCQFKLPQFPFIYIPKTTSAADVRSTKPFFWLCIVAVATRSTSQRDKLYAHIRSLLGQTLVGELDRSLEQLWGLLVCIAWGNLQVHRRPFLTLFTQLAITVVFDLGLNKAPPEGLDERSKYRFHKPWVTRTRTMGERRAVLSCFLISSMVSNYLHRIDSLRWTTHMNDCLGVLEETKECENDEILVALVRLQLIVEKVRISAWQNEETKADGGPEQPPPAFYARILESELQGVIQLIPSNLAKNNVLLTHAHSTKLAIHGLALWKRETICRSESFGHLESLWSCFTALEAYFNAFLKFTPQQYLGFTSCTLLQVTHCLFRLYCLLSVDDPVWDRKEIMKRLDLVGICRETTQNFRDAAVYTGFQSDKGEDTFTKLATNVDSAMCHWRSRLIDEGLVCDDSWNDETTPLPDDFTSGLSEDLWLTDLLAPGEWLQ